MVVSIISDYARACSMQYTICGVTMCAYIMELKEWGEILKGFFLCNNEKTSFENPYLEGFDRM